ncbi:MAG: ABC transporter substrate-binding protein [Acidimicrobiia bacterium]|nr:ABC transporter substrate-binding protein [Acidimicrobiia bacterium]MYG58631.1 ABC transporter substrate-binding protein [Acidimicrobiia bacterium]MYJ34091.1 ABC transporter substrate-binding protein [Acidimicrobiia bacterium]
MGKTGTRYTVGRQMRARRSFEGGNVKHFRWLICLLAVFALVAAACGGNDDDDSGAAAPDVAPTEAPDDEMDDDMDDEMDESMDDEMDDDMDDEMDESMDDDMDDEMDESMDDDMDDDEPEPVATEEPEVDPCEAVDLEATDIGITSDTITVLVMADVGSPLAPGLFQGSIDGVKAWADHVNSEGGLACRQVEVIEHDSAINPTETTNGFLVACEEAFALVGTTALFALDTTDLQSCPDAAGNDIGVPDFAYITTEPPHQCSVVTFATSRPNSECPYAGTGPRAVQSQVGHVQWLLENVESNLNGVYLVPSDLPSTIASTMPQLRSFQELGIVIDGEPGVSGFTTQSEYGAYIQVMRDADSNFAYTGSDDQSMIKWRSEAEAQGLDVDSIIWMCQLACYTPSFLEAGDVIENTYIWLWFLPIDEVDHNQELADFMQFIDNDFPPAWAAGSWADGVLFEQVVNNIVAEGGPNAVTRQAVLDGARSLTSFDVNGWWSPADYSTTENIMPCFMLMQVQNNDFVRVHPTAPGELDCDADNVVGLTKDWGAEFGG